MASSRVEQRFAKNAAAVEVRHGDGCRLEIFADIGHRSGSFLIQPAGTGVNGEKLVWWRCSACNALFSDLTPLAVRQAPPAQSDQHAP
jgi:hypothetical protein